MVCDDTPLGCRVVLFFVLYSEPREKEGYAVKKTIIQRLRRHLSLQVTWCTLLSLSLLTPESHAQTDSLGVVHVIYSGRVLTNINQSDAQAAIELWVREVMHSLDVVLQPKIYFFDQLSDILKAIDGGHADMVNLNIVEYLQLQDFLDPILVSSQEAEMAGRYLLLAHRNSQLNQLRDLSNSHLMIESCLDKGSISMLWFELELLRAGLYDPEASFFSHTDRVDKTMAAVLPVLMGQADAALVQAYNFSTLIELNPQLQRYLKVLLTSPTLLPAVSCVPRNFDPRRRQIMLQSALRLSETARGAQIMALFGVDRLHPFRPELLAPIKGLIAERDSLMSRLTAPAKAAKHK